jgi:mono/diheme cytochrome c family protein
MRLPCLVVGTAALVAAGVWQARAAPEPRAKQPSGPDTADLRKHGAYLVNAAILCGDCHTPQDDRGMPDRARLLRGATLPIRPKKEIKNWAAESPDITGSGLAGKWGEEEMVKFLTTGINPEGKKARPPMPPFRLNARDARAVFLYLKSLPGAKEGGDGGKVRKDPNDRAR